MIFNSALNNRIAFHTSWGNRNIAPSYPLWLIRLIIQLLPLFQVGSTVNVPTQEQKNEQPASERKRKSRFSAMPSAPASGTTHVSNAKPLPGFVRAGSSNSTLSSVSRESSIRGPSSNDFNTHQRLEQYTPLSSSNATTLSDGNSQSDSSAKKSRWDTRG